MLDDWTTTVSFTSQRSSDADMNATHRGISASPTAEEVHIESPDDEARCALCAQHRLHPFLMSAEPSSPGRSIDPGLRR